MRLRDLVGALVAGVLAAALAIFVNALIVRSRESPYKQFPQCPEVSNRALESSVMEPDGSVRCNYAGTKHWKWKRM